MVGEDLPELIIFTKITFICRLIEIRRVGSLRCLFQIITFNVINRRNVVCIFL